MNLHMYSGECTWITKIYIVQSILAVFVIVGFWPSCCAFLLWYLGCSETNRMPLAVTGGDVLLRSNQTLALQHFMFELEGPVYCIESTVLKVLSTVGCSHASRCQIQCGPNYRCKQGQNCGSHTSICDRHCLHWCRWMSRCRGSVMRCVHAFSHDVS